jgi:hypothetical protein
MLGRPMDAAEPEGIENEPDGGIEVEIEAPRRRAAADDGDDPFERLQSQYDALQAQKAESDRTAAEAARHIEAVNAALKAAQDRDEIARAWSEESTALAQAQRSYVDNQYDAAAQAAALVEIAQHTANLSRYQEAHQNLNALAVYPAAPQRQAVQADPFEDAIAGLGESDKQFVRRHREDLAGNPARGQILQSHALIAELPVDSGGYGLQPGSPEYHAHLAGLMGYDDGDGEPVRQAKRQGGTARRPMAAPSSRATSSSYSKVALSEDHKRQAKELKMSEAEFSKFVRKSGQGQLGKGVTGGRLHASYSVTDTY